MHAILQNNRNMAWITREKCTKVIHLLEMFFKYSFHNETNKTFQIKIVTRIFWTRKN